MENIVWTLTPLPLILGAVIRMFIGGLWYSPVLFGKPWMRMMKFEPEDFKSEEFKRDAKRGYIIASGMSLVISYLVGVVIQTVAPDSGGAILIMFVVTLGFTLPIALNRHLWDSQPWGLFPIHMGYEWTSYILMGLFYVWL